MSSPTTPIRVTVSRGVIESEHLVDAVVVDGSEALLRAGDTSRSILARSAIKPIQVLPLLETGAAERFEVTDDEIALGTASHSAEPEHLLAVDRWLTRIGLDRDALECGPDRPLGPARADELLRLGEEFAPIHNCCSGKHAAFLTVAKHLGHDPAGYIERDHPVQLLVADAISRYTGIALTDHEPGIDGCGIPTFAIPLAALAGAMQRLVTSDDVSASTVTRVLPGRAFWISGTDRHEHFVEGHATEPLLLKGGAEGVFMGALPTRGIGFALKARDGAQRAANTAVSLILHELGAVNREALATTVTNKAGTVVGMMEAELQ